jgi:cysteinyl-tRNA synthetase
MIPPIIATARCGESPPSSEVMNLAHQYAVAKEIKNYEESDRLREKIKSLGWAITHNKEIHLTINKQTNAIQL